MSIHMSNLFRYIFIFILYNIIRGGTMNTEIVYEEIFPQRLATLRTSKGVSARDMSLSIGQSAGYIFNLESGKSLPSMSVFFCICDYLEITPKDFFDFESKVPEKLNNLISSLKSLDDGAIEDVTSIVARMKK